MFGNFSPFKTPFPGWVFIPNSFVSLFIFYILSYLISKTMGCLSGCLMSTASIQKLFCGICSAFKCSFDKFVGEKMVSPSYSSTILGPPLGRSLEKKMTTHSSFPSGKIPWIEEPGGLQSMGSQMTEELDMTEAT